MLSLLILAHQTSIFRSLFSASVAPEPLFPWLGDSAAAGSGLQLGWKCTKHPNLHRDFSSHSVNYPLPALLSPPPPPPATSTTQITLESQSTGNSSHLSVTKEADGTGKQEVICTWWGGHSWETNRWATTWIWAILWGKQNCMRNTQIIRDIMLNSLTSSCWADCGPETLDCPNIWLWES